jgi:hypothetical protein
MGEIKQVEHFDIVDRDEKQEIENTIKDMDIMEILLSGKTIKKTLKTNRGDFICLYPTGRDRLRMDQIRAVRRRGISANTFDDIAELNNNVWSTLDVIIIDGPQWYRNAKKNNPGWSWEEGPDEELTLELYNQARSFRGDIAEKIKQSQVGRPVERIELPADTTPMDDGTFSGITNRPKSRKDNRSSG